MIRLLNYLERRVPRWLYNRWVQALLDGVVSLLAIWTAYGLRFEFHFAPASRYGLLLWAGVMPVARPLWLLLLRAYDHTWRFFSARDAFRLALRALSLSAVILGLKLLLSGPLPLIPYSVLILDLGIYLSLAVLLRFLRRQVYHASRATEATHQYRTLLIGSDKLLALALAHVCDQSDVNVVGLVSEDANLVGMRIDGVPVLGTPRQLPHLLAKHEVEVVILSGSDLPCCGSVMEIAPTLGAQVRILPSAHDLLNGRVEVRRTVGMEQVARLLPSRPLLRPHPQLLQALGQRSVLVTGAGGSIGSEISRQVSQLPVATLLMLDQDENSIFELQGQLATQPGRKLISLVGDIRDEALLERTFSQYRPQVVLHAAAYKHVPVMEQNACEAVLNNVLGTRQLVDAAIRFQCERFVMISTDKAVRPASVMGATKRIAEMLVQHKAQELNGLRRTQFACVRFGNVVGSRGSVVPIFLRQIHAGGPVTITHKEMTRYFMTIPQAVELVLQAATLASDGEVLMLDMGDPVKIVDFARELIRLAGLIPDTDIKIEVTGIRPGEKLHEQLWGEDASVNPTEFPQIYRVQNRTIPGGFSRLVEELETSAKRRVENQVIVEFLHRLPVDFRTRKGDRGGDLARAADS